MYITSDVPGAGKTIVASCLAAQVSVAGKRVGYFKPFSATPQEDADVEFIVRSVLPGQPDSAQPVPLPMPDGPAMGQTLAEDVAQQLRQSLESVASTNELVLVEGPSLSNRQADISQVSARLVDLLDATVLLVLRYSPSLDVSKVLKATEPFKERLRGVVINSVTRYKEREVRLNLAPAVEAMGIKVIGVIPEDRIMLSVTLGQIAELLDGQWVLGKEKAQELVWNFLIGGNIMDSGITYFGRMENKAVFVRGDRPDIQLASLSTTTTCLVLTGGNEPIQYVYHEADQQEVPLLVVQADTISTAHALDTVLERSTVHHPRKLERFQELVRAHADLAAIE